MLFSVLWLSAALAIGFVPNNQRGIFVEEKQRVLVLFVFCFCFFFLAHRTLGDSRKPFLKLFKLAWIQTSLRRMKTGLRHAVQAVLCPSQREMAVVDICHQIRAESWASARPAAHQCFGLAALYLLEVSVHLQLFLSTTGNLFIFSKASDLSESPNFGAQTPAKKQAESLIVQQTGEPRDVCTQTRFQLFCRRALPTQPVTPPPPFPPSRVPVV